MRLSLDISINCPKLLLGFVNTNGGRSEIEEETNLEFVSETHVGRSVRARTPYFFNVVKAVDQYLEFLFVS